MIYVGLITSWDVGTYTAGVQVRGSLARVLSGVAVNRAIADADMVVGRKVLVWVADTELVEAVVIAVWA